MSRTRVPTDLDSRGTFPQRNTQPARLTRRMPQRLDLSHVGFASLESNRELDQAKRGPTGAQPGHESGQGIGTDTAVALTDARKEEGLQACRRTFCCTDKDA